MSLGGRMMLGAEAYQVVPVACLPPQPPHQSAVACLTRHPNTHTTWAATTTTYGSYHPPYQGPYGAIHGLTAPPPLMQGKLSSDSPPVSKCPSVPLPQLSRTSFHVGYYVPPSVEPGDLYGGLEQVWNQHFELLFRHLPHVWSFGPADTTPKDWLVFRDMAKVRFSCQRCAHGWTSMYGLVVFYYRWDAASNQGFVRFLLTGQKCNQCDLDDFETPMWYPEEAQKVMTNLYHEVASRIYRLQTPPLIRDRRHGRPRQQHNTHMCEGCRQGLCKTTKAPQPSPATQT